MDRRNHQDIRIGTLARMPGCLEYLPQIVDHGFESFQLTNSRELPAEIDSVAKLAELAQQVKDLLGERAIIDSIGIYGNPLVDEATHRGFEILIDAASEFGATTVCGFTGCLPDVPVDASIARFAEVFGDLEKRASDRGVKIGFENCDMGGTWESPRWNIAHSPRAWEMMFDAVPGEAIGLEWEPCHQMVSLIDPIPQLRKWIGRVVHVHGKDATTEWDTIRTQGIRSGVRYVHHRTPGFGESDWTLIISILRANGWTGSIDIEGWHDPVYRDDLEMTGQVYALEYLKRCRGGAFVENPKG